MRPASTARPGNTKPLVESNSSAITRTDRRTPTLQDARLFELDTLRGLACLAVMLCHYTATHKAAYIPVGPWTHFFSKGHYGVLLFFMISGFVIFMSLERSPNTKSFLLSRFARLFPGYWVCVTLTTLVLLFSGIPDQHVTLLEYAVNLTMLQRFVYVAPVDGVYWTLAVELVFYGIILAIVRCGGTRRMVVVGSVWLCLQWLCVLSEVLGLKIPSMLKLLLLLQFAHCFVAGTMFFELYRNNRNRSCKDWSRHLVIAACVATQYLLTSLEAAVIMAAFCLIFYAIVYGCFPKWLCNRTLIWMGCISYPVYLLHQEIGGVLMWMLHPWGLPPVALFLIPICLVLPLAHLITFALERPIQRKLREWGKRREQSSVRPTAPDFA